MNSEIQGNCWHCHRALAAANYGRENNCPGCTKPTRVCRNCRHFGPGRPNDCLEPMAEPVLDKVRANFCEFFEPAERPAAAGERSTSEALLQAAQDLFK